MNIAKNNVNYNYNYSLAEALDLYNNTTLSELMVFASEIRHKIHPENYVGWIIDRNVNITNICTSACMFCNFYRGINHSEAYITTIDQYRDKIQELIVAGGNQLLLQGGMHPSLGLDFYTHLFKSLKSEFPTLKLHALGPAEIVHIAKLEQSDYYSVLQTLINSGLDSLPGAGAEILSNRVRKLISPSKCSADEWLDVMRQAHKLNLVASATMMFGHIETIEERIDHIIKIRDLQAEKPIGSPGFLSFIPWPFQSKDTRIEKNMPNLHSVTASEYIRMIAISRILLHNIPNIQASWLTVGPDVASVCLHAGANDMGSIMIEENVVSAAGAEYSLDAAGIQKLIRSSGFEPFQRNQQFGSI